jgi:hypothetical protein
MSLHHCYGSESDCRLCCCLVMLKSITGLPNSNMLCHASADEQQVGPTGMPDNKAASFARAFARIMQSGGTGRGLLQVGAPFTLSLAHSNHENIASAERPCLALQQCQLGNFESARLNYTLGHSQRP